MIALRGLEAARRRLAALPVRPALQKAGAESGATLQSAVKAELAARTAERSGHSYRHLAETIGVEVTADRVVVGTSDRGAPFLECGTRHEQPKPFMAPVAADSGARLIEACGAAIGEAMREVVK